MASPLLPAALAALCLAPAAALAQCSIGVYADPAGEVTEVFDIGIGDSIPLYVLLWVEDVVDAVGYDLDIPDEQHFLYLVELGYGPEGNGINVQSPNGDNVGLGDCYPGFGGNPLLVAHYELLSTVELGEATIGLRPNPDSGGGSESPVYSNCAGDLLPCQVISELGVRPVATEALSFGRVKALFTR